MNRTMLFTAAAMMSAALAFSGCEQERSYSKSSSSSSSSTSARTGSARGETIQATGQPGIGADRGTGTTPSGVTTGNVATGAPAADRTDTARASSTSGEASASASGADRSVSANADIDRAEASARASDVAKASAASSAKSSDATDAVADAAKASADAERRATAKAKTDAAVAEVLDDTVVAADPAAVAALAAAKAGGAVAHVKPAGGAPKDMQVTGTVTFTPDEHGVKVVVDLKGLTPNGKHGFHIHEKGDLSDPKLQSVGPHFNPGGKKHGGPEGDERHGGDLGNLTADDKGNVKTEIMAHGVSIAGEKDGIVGRSIIVHAKADDLKTDPSGNSGDRIAGGKIEKADAEKSADAGAAPIEADAQPAAEKLPAAQDANK